MKTVYLHIGHGKTGSPYVQSFLGRSIAELAQSGIHYPIAGYALSYAENGKISSGNGRGILQTANSFQSWLKKASAGHDMSVLASHEGMYRGLGRWIEGDADCNLQTLEAQCRAHGFTRVSVMFYVRSPLDFLPSSWQQTIKRGGNTQTLAEFAEANDASYLKVASTICRLKDASNIVDVTVHNYGAQKASLRADFASWLGVHPDLLSEPPQRTVNRSF